MSGVRTLFYQACNILLLSPFSVHLAYSESNIHSAYLEKFGVNHRLLVILFHQSLHTVTSYGSNNAVLALHGRCCLCRRAGI